MLGLGCRWVTQTILLVARLPAEIPHSMFQPRAASSTSDAAVGPFKNNAVPPGSKSGKANSRRRDIGARARAVKHMVGATFDVSRRSGQTRPRSSSLASAVCKNAAFRRSDSMRLTSHPVTMAIGMAGKPPPEPISVIDLVSGGIYRTKPRLSSTWRAHMQGARSLAETRFSLLPQTCNSSMYRPMSEAVSRETFKPAHPPVRPSLTMGTRSTMCCTRYPLPFARSRPEMAHASFI